MQRRDEIQRLLSDLDDHDDDEGLAENVWSDVVTAMERASGTTPRLQGRGTPRGGADASGPGVAARHTRPAAVHERLEWLAAQESERAHSGRQAAQPLPARWVAGCGPVRAAGHTRYR